MTGHMINRCQYMLWTIMDNNRIIPKSNTKYNHYTNILMCITIPMGTKYDTNEQ